MKLALDEKIWDRLYGPYGNQSVNDRLAQLSDRWDNAIARELFWEELHHQDDIYPVTFAALPWLTSIAPQDGEGFEETQIFISHVIHCAHLPYGTGCDGTGPRGRYRGLSTCIADHHHSWLPKEQWLKDEDQPILYDLESWFSENSVPLAENCLAMVGGDPTIAAYALEGFATLKGSKKVAYATQRFAAVHGTKLIHRELGDYNTDDSHVVGLLYPHIWERSPKIAAFLLDYPGCTYTPKK